MNDFLDRREVYIKSLINAVYSAKPQTPERAKLSMQLIDGCLCYLMAVTSIYYDMDDSDEDFATLDSAVEKIYSLHEQMKKICDLEVGQ